MDGKISLRPWGNAHWQILLRLRISSASRIFDVRGRFSLASILYNASNISITGSLMLIVEISAAARAILCRMAKTLAAI
jgi:hypothetical protein